MTAGQKRGAKGERWESNFLLNYCFAWFSFVLPFNPPKIRIRCPKVVVAMAIVVT